MLAITFFCLSYAIQDQWEILCIETKMYIFPTLTSCIDQKPGSTEPGDGAVVHHSLLFSETHLLLGCIVHNSSCVLASLALWVTPFFFLITLAPSSVSFLLTLHLLILCYFNIYRLGFLILWSLRS